LRRAAFISGGHQGTARLSLEDISGIARSDAFTMNSVNSMVPLMNVDETFGELQEQELISVLGVLFWKWWEIGEIGTNLGN